MKAATAKADRTVRPRAMKAKSEAALTTLRADLKTPNA